MGSNRSRLALNIAGMHCAGCVKSVTRVLSAVPGVQGVDIDLTAGRAEITGTADYDALAAAIARAGFDASPE